jgi:hypothetical protein
MDAVELRPRLASFRVVAFSGKFNAITAKKPVEIALEMQPQIDLELRVPTEEEKPLEAFVRIQINGTATPRDEQEQPIGKFEAEYEARFVYPSDAKEPDISSRFEREPYQYSLISQVFPLASSHFRRELLSMGIDARTLPLGL